MTLFLRTLTRETTGKKNTVLRFFYDPLIDSSGFFFQLFSNEYFASLTFLRGMEYTSCSTVCGW